MENYYSEDEDEKISARSGLYRRPNVAHRQEFVERTDDPRYAAQYLRQHVSQDPYREDTTRMIPREHSRNQYAHPAYIPPSEPQYRQSEFSSRTNAYPSYPRHEPYIPNDARDYYQNEQPRSYDRHSERYISNSHPMQDYGAYNNPRHEQNYERSRGHDLTVDNSWATSRSRVMNSKSLYRPLNRPDPRYLYQDNNDPLPQLTQHALREHPETRNPRSSMTDYQFDVRPISQYKQPIRHYNDLKYDSKFDSGAVRQKNNFDPSQKIMRFTSFPVFYIPSCRNTISGFSQVDAPRAQDVLNTVKNAPFVEFEDGEELELDLSKNCIILHPGSRNIRLGLAGDPFPKELPHVIARRTRNPTEPKEAPQSNLEERLDDAISWGEAQLLQRLQDSRRKPSQNAQGQVLEFNSSVSPTSLPDHNDPYKREQVNLQDGPEVLVGDKVSILPEKSSGYKIRYPLLQGKLNTRDYDSLFEVRSDLEELWSSLIQEKVGISVDAFEGYSIGLVIPDQYCPVYVSQAVDIFLTTLGFHSIFLIQESVSATFGAGISSACVVNVGAQNTSVACVEEGFCLPQSRITMPYGGDDVTSLLVQLLHRSNFPYKSLDIRQHSGWHLAEKLKWQLANMNENELSIHLSQFYVPVPGCPTLKFDIKVYDEGFIAPMLYFNPLRMDLNMEEKQQLLEISAPWLSGHVLQLNDLNKDIQSGLTKKSYMNPSTQSVTPANANSTPHSYGIEDEDLEEDFELANIAMETEEELTSHSLLDPAIALDSAIAKSIRAIAGDDTVSRRWYSCILITGGGAALIPGFADMLTNTLRTSAPIGTNIEVLTSVRDLDPRDLSWKGASVYAKLDTSPETFINFREWELRGLHAVKEKLLFGWSRA